MPLKIKNRFIDQEMTTDEELNAGLATKENIANKNQPNGYAGLNAQGKINESLIPYLTVEMGFIDGGNPNSLYLLEDTDGGSVNGN